MTIPDAHASEIVTGTSEPSDVCLKTRNVAGVTELTIGHDPAASDAVHVPSSESPIIPFGPGEAYPAGIGISRPVQVVDPVWPWIQKSASSLVSGIGGESFAVESRTTTVPVEHVRVTVTGAGLSSEKSFFTLNSTRVFVIVHGAMPP